MNNIAQFPSFIDYPELNVVTLRQSASAANNAAIDVRRLFTQTNYLPTLHSRVIGLDDALRDAVFRLQEVASSTETKLSINTATLRDYQQELASSTDFDRQEILEDISKQTATIQDVVSTAHTRFRALLTPMKEPIDRVASLQYLAQLAVDQERLPTEIVDIQERLSTLRQQRQTLTDAMALIESKGFAQVGKDTLLNAQEIAKLGIAGPEVAVVEKAIELAQQLAEKLEALINYFGLIDARDKIRKQMDDLLVRVHDKTSELRIAGMKSELITACHSFDDHRNLYVGEFEKMIVAQQSFLRVYRSVAAQDEQALTQLVVDALSLVKYLKLVA